MLYRLFFRDGIGHPLTLSGFKVVRERSGVHVWCDTSTLYVRVLRGHVEEGNEPGAETVASGILHLRPLDFAKQLATFRARGPSTIGQVAAICHFAALFLGAPHEQSRVGPFRGVPPPSGFAP